MLMFIVSTMQNMGFWKCAIVELTWRHPEMHCALNPAVGASRAVNAPTTVECAKLETIASQFQFWIENSTLNKFASIT